MTWAPAYATAVQLQAHLRGATGDETELDLAIEAASRAIDQACNRQFGKVDIAEERVYTATRDRYRSLWTVDVDDLSTTDGLTVETDDGTVDGVRAYPANNAAKGRPFTKLIVPATSTVQPDATEDGVTVSGVWGWAAVPDAIVQATLLQAARLFQRRDAPFGVAGSPEMGSEVRLLDRLDPDVAVSLRRYVRQWGAA